MVATAIVSECTDRQGSDVEFWLDVNQYLAPGASIFVHVTSGNPTRTALALRRAGFERRDTLLFYACAKVEVVLFFRKPLSFNSIAKQIVETGSGAINIDACIVPGVVPVPTQVRSYRRFDGKYDGKTADGEDYALKEPPEVKDGRWPPNLVFQHLPDCFKSGVLQYQHLELDQCTCAPGCLVEALKQQSKDCGVIGSKTPHGIINDGHAERAFPRFTERKALKAWLEDLARTPK